LLTSSQLRIGTKVGAFRGCDVENTSLKLIGIDFIVVVITNMIRPAFLFNFEIVPQLRMIVCMAYWASDKNRME
jgi:hypothetical protein